MYGNQKNTHTAVSSLVSLPLKTARKMLKREQQSFAPAQKYPENTPAYLRSGEWPVVVLTDADQDDVADGAYDVFANVLDNIFTGVRAHGETSDEPCDLTICPVYDVCLRPAC